ncbi:DUF2793 domain-containing protein [Pseudomonas asplenii]|uniref:Chaperone of endosialidase n=1 Tax=Pseudomonas asplenii TaxID=53407 RepID=A0A1H6P964_9PSED|nr:DUF2793 domain-containing protein [Pseudomonas fuscovaginae]SEI21462.1 Chaperone of endosialidase [Pseudomonas fuscovaginae]
MTLKTNSPNLGVLVSGAAGDLHFQELLRQWRAIDALVQPSVISRVATVPTSGAVDGDRYLLTAAPISGKIARYSADANSVTGWEYYTPGPGWRVYVASEKVDYQFVDGAWKVATAGGGAVSSVAGKTGDVTLLASDVSAVAPPVLDAASTTDIYAPKAPVVQVRGTGGVTFFGSGANGQEVNVVFNSAIDLSASASLVLPGNRNLRTAVGDVAGFVYMGSGVTRCQFYHRADGGLSNGSAGVGTASDLRSVPVSYGTPPSAFFDKYGTTFGFVDGGSSSDSGAPGLAIPAFGSAVAYGILTTHRHWGDQTAGGGIHQLFSDGQRLFMRKPSGASAWTTWLEILTSFNSASLPVDTSLSPSVDNSKTLGASGKRWSTVWAGTGTISTSDARHKTSVRMLTANELSASKALAQEVGAYRWLQSIKDKGGSAREHIGLTVQRAIEIMREHDLDPFTYGFICYDEWEAEVDERPEVVVQGLLDDGGFAPTGEVRSSERVVVRPAGDLYSFRVDQLNLFILAGFEARLALLEQNI